MRALPVRDELFASTRAFLLEARLCCNATTGGPSARRLPRLSRARLRRRRMIASPFTRGIWLLVYLAFAAGEAPLEGHAFRPARSPPLPPDRRGGLDHAGRRARAPRARRRLDPHPP